MIILSLICLAIGFTLSMSRWSAANRHWEDIDDVTNRNHRLVLLAAFDKIHRSRTRYIWFPAKCGLIPISIYLFIHYILT